MSQPLGGPGLSLPIPQNLYPSELFNAPIDMPANQITLSPGDTLPVPTGVQFVSTGDVSLLQLLDPITGVWRGFDSARYSHNYIKSDGQNVRLANLTGCPVACVVENGGSGYLQGNTTVNANTGNSTWQPIVGGQVSLTTINNAGKNYSIAPLVLIQPPPMAQAQNAPAPSVSSAPLGGYGGIPALAYATISAGTVSGVTFSQAGAGYPSAPSATILPSPNDPNFASITAATITLGLTGSGAITGVLCTNNGSPLATLSALTLTAAGSGSGATLGVAVMQCVTGGSITAAGGGITGTGPALLTTVGGTPGLTSSENNPFYELTGYRPRAASVGLTLAGNTVSAIGTVYDSGLFVGTPAPIVSYPGAAATFATVTLTMGSKTDTVTIQPAP